MTTMLPYFHPTTCLAVDDDKLFLESFENRYGEDILCATEANPLAALDRLLKQKPASQPKIPMNSPSRDADAGLSGGSETISLPDLAQGTDRFAAISVLVVDYSMPALTGIDLCRRIKHLPVKKILLTGKAGDETAVSAFNERLIDFFLVKQHENLPEILPREIERLQKAYFAERAAALVPLTSSEDAAFLGEPKVAAWIETAAKKFGAVEHYLTASPPGVLLVDKGGKTAQVYVYSEDLMRSHREIAADEQAPEALMARLEAGDGLLACPSQSGCYEKRFAGNWRQFLFAAKRIQGSAAWTIALNPDPPLNFTATSLEVYRRSLGP